MRLLTRYLREERGSALVLVTVAMVILLGTSALAFDYGRLVLKKRTLANAADAAALAAAQELLKEPAAASVALSTAEAYAAANGAAADQVTADISPDHTQITVTISAAVDYTFARVFGFTQRELTAAATAAVGAVTGMPMPPPDDCRAELVQGQEYELNLLLLDLGPQLVPHWEERSFLP